MGLHRRSAIPNPIIGKYAPIQQKVRRTDAEPISLPTETSVGQPPSLQTGIGGSEGGRRNRRDSAHGRAEKDDGPDLQGVGPASVLRPALEGLEFRHNLLE